MNEKYQELLDEILYIFQEVVRVNVEEDLGVLIPYANRREMMQELRKAFPAYRITGDFNKLRIIEDAVNAVWEAYGAKQRLISEIADLVFEVMSSKKYVSAKHYAADEELFSEILPQAADDDNQKFIKKRVYDYHWLSLHAALVRKYQFCPGNIPQLEQAKTIGCLMEIFYRRDRF